MALAILGPLQPSSVSARPIPVRYEECRLVFSGRDTLGEPVIASLILASGTGPTGTTVREYRGWIGRGTAWEPLFDRKWSGDAPSGGEIESVFPAAFGVIVRGRTDKSGPFRRPKSLEVAWSDELRAISLTAEELQADFRRPLDQEPSDLYRSADPASFRREQGVSPAALTVGFEKIEGRVFHEFVACLGSSPYLEGTTAPGHFGDYDRSLLWDEEGSFWLVEAGTRAGTLKASAEAVWMRGGKAASRLTADAASLTRLGMKPLPQARRQIPEAWRVQVPAWEFEASVRAQGQTMDVGDAGPRGQKPVYARFRVAGEAIVGGAIRPVFGIVEHVQD